MHTVLKCTVDVWAPLAQTEVNINVISMPIGDNTDEKQYAANPNHTYYVVA